ncbi:secreted RxLR effector protein 161-like [Impatiens glandulifera]|uniref:secreted RxLR effector protein 161-like n=1 Tax=Impatiens glandulifera TaxID=253017 RepID=UPI001FB0931C|nr:secreted RxLR effector protein 161-like [Impatiens glandulifera]
MSDAKFVNVPLAFHFVLNKNQYPKTETEITEMKNVPYSNAIGAVMYLMISIMPDVAYTVSCLSSFMYNPRTKLVGYVDSNYANDRDNRKSITSCVFTLCGSCISWKSQLQPIVALSTTESEYIVVTETFKEAIWLMAVLSEIGFLDNNVVVFSDSKSSIQLWKALFKVRPLWAWQAL